MFVILSLYAAHNPSSFGSCGWTEFPTLRAFMEMCITNQFVFPPPTMFSKGSGGEAGTADLFLAAEAATTAHEREAILQLERHLAAATHQPTITEANSLLLAQLIAIDPKGPLRKPPPQVLESLQQINQVRNNVPYL